MSENKHTPEPWCISDHNKSIIKCYQGEQTPHGTTPYFAGGGALESERTANARRVVACVNALEGLNDYALSGGWSFRGIEAYAKGLEEQRDELLAALERCRFALEPYDDIKPRDWKSDRLNLRDAHQVAVAAIAGVKGEQP